MVLSSIQNDDLSYYLHCDKMTNRSKKVFQKGEYDRDEGAIKNSEKNG